MMKMIDMRQGSDSGLFAGLVGRNRIGEGDVLRTVEDIISKVRTEGDRAIIEYTMKFDKVQLDQTSLKVTQQEIN